MPRGHIMEDNQKIDTKIDAKIVSVELSEEQYAFLKNLQKTQETELGIEVPVGAMVRKIVEAAMKNQNKPEFAPRPERRDGDRPSFGGRDGGKPSFGDRPRPSFGSRDGGRPSFGDRPRPSFGGGSRDGGRPSFGDRPRPSFGGDRRGGSKFDMTGVKSKTRKFEE